MKKAILSLALLGALALPAGALAAAPDAAMFQKEEDLADRWTQTMLVQQKPDAARSLLSAEAQKSIDQKKVQEISDNVAKQLGKMKEARFVSWTRFDQADQMLYLMGFEKGGPMRCLLTFDKQGGLVSFMLGNWPQQKAAADDKAQNSSQPAKK